MNSEFEVSSKPNLACGRCGTCIFKTYTYQSSSSPPTSAQPCDGNYHDHSSTTNRDGHNTHRTVRPSTHIQPYESSLSHQKPQLVEKPRSSSAQLNPTSNLGPCSTIPSIHLCAGRYIAHAYPKFPLVAFIRRVEA